MAANNRDITRQIENLLSEIGRTTGVSREFLEEARPAAEKLFREVPEDQHEQVLEVFHQSARCQAQTEAHLNNAMSLTHKLAQKEAAYIEKVKELKSRIDYTYASVAHLLLSSHGGFDEPDNRIVCKG
ncbi:MAG: hypothetical protein GY854_03230 [Deltaproteobacteria bacterium]|nr:hypothetical protein [Deltaproteobacteria bacterium]